MLVGNQLNTKIEDIITKAPCACSGSPKCQQRHPMGRYSIGIAIVGNITGTSVFLYLFPVRFNFSIGKFTVNFMLLTGAGLLDNIAILFLLSQ